MEHTIIIKWDEEAHVWYAACDSIPIALESGSLDALIERIKIAAPEMLAENGILSSQDRLCFKAERREKIA